VKVSLTIYREYITYATSTSAIRGDLISAAWGSNTIVVAESYHVVARAVVVRPKQSPV